MKSKKTIIKKETNTIKWYMYIIFFFLIYIGVIALSLIVGSILYIFLITSKFALDEFQLTNGMSYTTTDVINLAGIIATFTTATGGVIAFILERHRNKQKD